MRKRRLFVFILSLFVTIGAFPIGISDNRNLQKTFGKTTSNTVVADKNTDSEKLVVYKRLYQKNKQRTTFGRSFPGLSPQAMAQRLGKKVIPASGSQLTLYGSMTTNPAWGDNTTGKYGMYTFTSPSYTTTQLKADDDLVPNGGGVLVGDTYYCINFYSFYGYKFVYFERYNANTWEFLNDEKTSIQDVATDLTYDPITEKVYGCFVNDNDNGYVWATLNLETGKRQQIAPIDNSMIALAANAEGVIYGIDCDANLYTVNKATGAQTLVGATGLDIDNITQSAVFDMRKNELYWTACLKDGTTGLYKVNTSTGEASLVVTFPDKEQYQGIFIKTPLAEDGAPAAVTSVTPNFVKGSCTGAVSFTAPVKTFAGDDLTGDLTYTVTANGTTMATGTTTAGADVNVTVTVPGGQTKFGVTTSNAVGKSPSTVVDIFVGKDAPAAVGNLKLEVTDRETGNVRLSWAAPSTTLNGGYLDAEALRYKVVRYPDSVTVAENMTACEYTEKLGTEALVQYSYQVTPSVGDLVGTPAVSNKVKMGSHCVVPYVETFDTPESLDNFTVIDGYDDGDTWVFRTGWDMVQSRYSFKNPMDEWLITPPIYLEQGKLYKLTFTSSSKRVYPDRLEVKMGQGTSAQNMVTTLVKDTLYTTDEYVTDVVYDFDLDVKVDKTGDYNIGFHAMADQPQMSDLRLDDIRLTEVSALDCPDRVTDLTATAGAQGALNATIAFNTPTKDVDGNVLQTLDKAEIYQGGKLLATIDDIEPGKSYSTVVPAQQGDNEYTVYVYNEKGKGLDSKVSVYCGVTVPACVSNVLLKEVDGHPVITWDAPTVGADGGYIDPAKLTYTVLRGADQTIVASDITETSFTDPYEVEGQTLQVYLIYAYNAAGMSKAAYSNYIVVGKGCYTVPFKESFAGASITQQPWSNTSTGSSSWWLTKDNSSVKAQDGDEGMIYFQGEGANETGFIFSGKISLAGTFNPALVTYLYYDDKIKSDIKLKIMATSDYINFTTLKVIDYNNFEGVTGWNKIVVPLTDFTDKPFVAVAYDATTGDGDFRHSIYLDNVNVIDNIENNITVTDFYGPASMLAGKTDDFHVVWRNDGVQAESNYTVELYQNDKKVDEYKGHTIQPGESMECVFHVTADAAMPENNTFYAYVNYAADQYVDNNKSDVLSTTVGHINYPTVTDLTGQYADGVSLSWSKPQTYKAQKPVTEGFETYTPFIIDNIGDWKLYDADGGTTYAITYKGESKQYLHATEPMAWQVFNAHEAGLDTTAVKYDIFMAHEGAQAIASFSSEKTETDNWLISPRLSGEAQLITFYVRTTVPNFGLETFEVLTSATDDEVKSFVKMDNINGEAPYEWTKISFAVPQGTRYFAIRGTSYQKLAMLVDDVTFIPENGEQVEMRVLGYNVYRDGVKLTEQPVNTTSFQDVVEENVTYQYQVSAVYDDGESVLSAPFLLTATGMRPLAADGVDIHVAKQCIIVSHCAGKAVKIYTPDGAVVYRAFGSREIVSVPVACGTYIVECDGQVRKFVVK